VPTAASGLNDWSDTYGADTRVGLVHATVNTAALSVYLASLVARARGKRARGKNVALAGFATLLAGSYLRGHLSFSRGVNVNRTAWQQGPQDWTPVLPDAELTVGQHRLANMGGPLDEGRIADGCVTCPWHASIFRFADGTVVRGPASSPQPRYETRIFDEHIEVRAAR